MTKWLNGDWIGWVPVVFKRHSLPEHYRNVFDSASGRIVLADLAKRAGIMAQSPHLDSDRMQYLAGARDQVLQIMAFLRMRPQDMQGISEREVIEHD